MVCVGNYLWLIGVTIFLLTTNSFGRSLEGIRRSTAMSLILLKNYQEQVSIHGEKADETQSLQFVDRWENTVGNRNTATEILNHVEKDWMYTLHLVSESENIITDLIVNLHTKILAMQQILPYVSSILYYSFASAGTGLADCQSIFFHLLIFIQEGTDKLLQGATQVLHSSLSTDELDAIENIDETLKATRVYYTVIKDLIDSIRPIATPEYGIKSIESQIQNMLNPIIINGNNYNQKELLLVKLMFGDLEESVRNECIIGPIRSIDQLKFFWATAKDINRHLTKQDIKRSSKNEYTMVDVIRVNLLRRAEINGVNRKNVVEKFECMIPDNFRISISDNRITNNINLEDKYC